MSINETVRVTAEHIEQGEPQEPEACPIALAIKAAHPDTPCADVYNEIAMLAQGAAVLEAELPPVARRFIHDFDMGDPVGPVEFELTWRKIEADQ